MSEGTTTANAVTPESANAVVGQAATEPEIQVAANSNEPINPRLERESRENKAKRQEAEKRANELQAKLDELERARLLEQGNIKAVLEKTTKELEDLKAARAEEQKAAKRLKIRTAVQTAAAKAGCLSPEDLTLVGNHSLLSFDDTTEELNGLDAFIEAAKRDKPWLFSQPKPPAINSAAPSVGRPALGYVDEIRMAKTQAEFDAIRKKHGRE